MKITYTPEQARAIEKQGNCIVSASAGSGKTFVMIEKIVKLVMEGASLSELLAVTFTKKAAGQMQEKLKAALVSAINAPETPSERKILLKQRLATLSQAEICTIHSFCSHLLRRYFYVLGIGSDFTVMGKDAEVGELQNEALSRLLDVLYESGDEDFYALLSVYWRKKSDNKLRDMILSTYNRIRSEADYRALLERASYGEEAFSAAAAEYKRLYEAELSSYLPALDALAAQAESLGLVKAMPVVAGLRGWIEAVFAAEDLFSLPPYPALPAMPRKKSSDPEGVTAFLSELGSLKEKMKKKWGDPPVDDASTERRRFLTAGGTAQALVRVILRFDEVYSDLKREKSCLDYADLEHDTLTLLQNEEIAAALREKYRYVFVDEYQDVNPVQERILSVFRENVFRVGDTKQSIYGFRGSKSVYFNRAFEEAKKSGEALLLTSNFRSAEGILDFVNRIFEDGMTEKSCGIDYASTSMMHGKGYEQGAGRVRIHFAPDQPRRAPEGRGVYSVKAHYLVREEDTSPQVLETERIIAEELNGEIVENGVSRPCTYGDIAVLARGIKDSEATALLRHLSDCGIPVATSAAMNVCDFSEVRQLLDLLSYVENPEQDIPLCSALLSPAGGLSEDDLAAVKLRFPGESSFFAACARYAGEEDALGTRLKAFYAYFEALRALAAVSTAGEILVKLLADYPFEAEYLAGANGAQRLSRVQRLIGEAQGSVTQFLDYVKNTKYNIPLVSSEGEDAVKLLTVHSSKGLEYPVVILFNASKPFHGDDVAEAIFDESYGLAVKCYDTDRRVAEETLLRKLVKKRKRLEETKDELNLFYVALTRAKWALHLVFKSETSYQKDRIPYAESYAEFMPFAKFRDLESNAEDVLAVPKRDAVVTRVSSRRKEDYAAAMRFVYPYESAVNLAVKSSASALLKERQTERDYYPVHELFGESSAEKGTAYHKFLQLVDFAAPFEGEYDRLREKFTPEEWSLLEEEKLKQILSMRVFSDLSGADLVREQKFLFSLPACELYDTDCADPVLVQGAIDLLVRGKTGYTVVDYKFSGKSRAELIDTYAPQLKLYRRAVSKILGVAEKTIGMVIVNILRGEEIPLFEKI